MSTDSKGYFEEIAPAWDRMRAGFFSERVREAAYEAAGLQAGRVAADIGAGTGFVTEGLIGRGLRVIAVDRSEAMLEELRRKFPDAAAVDYRLAEADRQIPLPDEAVDYAFANMYLHHVEDPPAAIREMARILRPGGKLVITDLDAHDFDFLRREHHDRWMGFNREDILQWFTGAGLKGARVDCVGERCCDTSCDGGEAASISIFVASGEKQTAAI
jgi:ubiquinone/menaquinone biosynthesis C-methylase UbiE